MVVYQFGVHDMQRTYSLYLMGLYIRMNTAPPCALWAPMCTEVKQAHIKTSQHNPMVMS